LPWLGHQSWWFHHETLGEFFYGKKGLILPRMMGILTNETGETW